MAEVDFKTWLGELKSRCDIVTVISRYCNVVPRGRSYWTCCPFHMEKTPSFCIYDSEQTYHCYGCKEFGDVIKFVMKIESCDFMQAVEILAKSVGMEVPNFSITNSDGIEKRKKEKDAVLLALKDAYEHYKQNLYTSQAKQAQEYIKKRELTQKELNDFGLGYSLGYDEMHKYLKTKGHKAEILQMAGLIEAGDHGFYDPFAFRLMFPIFNIYNECVGFSGRILTNDKNKAKYRNSSNTIVFDKSKTVYGLNLVRTKKQKEAVDKIIIVEGQMDVIAMHKAGFSNSVACLGTAFTLHHAKQLKLISNNAVVCLDGDGAGQKATFKIVDILAENGFNVRVVKIPDGGDPDEYVKAHGKDAMQTLIDSAIDYIDFKIDYLATDIDFSKSDQKAKFLRDVMNELNKLGSNSERQIYFKHIKELSGVPTDILKQDMCYNEKIVPKGNINEKIQTMEDGGNKAIKFLLASMLYKKPYVRNVNLLPFLKNNTYINLYNLIQDKKQNGEEFTISSLCDEFDFESEPNLVDIVNYNFDENGNNEKYYVECLWRLMEKHLKQKQNELNEQYAKCADINERKQILMEIAQITKKLKNKEMEE